MALSILNNSNNIKKELSNLFRSKLEMPDEPFTLIKG